MYDIMDEGFCLIDNLEEDNRESLPQLPALYLYASFWPSSALFEKKHVNKKLTHMFFNDNLS